MRAIDRKLERMLAEYASVMGRPRKGWKYRTLYEAQLKEGIEFSGESFTAEEEEILLQVFQSSERQKWQTKRCFYNAQALVLFESKLGYVEGFVLPPDLPILFDHAWAALGEKPVDVTLRE